MHCVFVCSGEKTDTSWCVNQRTLLLKCGPGLTSSAQLTLCATDASQSLVSSRYRSRKEFPWSSEHYARNLNKTGNSHKNKVCERFSTDGWTFSKGEDLTGSVTRLLSHRGARLHCARFLKMVSERQKQEVLECDVIMSHV